MLSTSGCGWFTWFIPHRNTSGKKPLIIILTAFWVDETGWNGMKISKRARQVASCVEMLDWGMCKTSSRSQNPTKSVGLGHVCFCCWKEMTNVNISCSISNIWSFVFRGDAEIFIAEDTGVVLSPVQHSGLRLVVSKILIRWSSPICFTNGGPVAGHGLRRQGRSVRPLQWGRPKGSAHGIARPIKKTWVCLKIVYPYTQWLMIIIPIKWL